MFYQAYLVDEVHDGCSWLLWFELSEYVALVVGSGRRTRHERKYTPVDKEYISREELVK